MNPLNSLTYWQEFFNLSTFSLLVVCGWMLLLWLLHFPLKNAAIVDAGWALGISFCAVYFAWNGSGIFPRRLLIALMVLIWGLRLGLHLLLNRVIGQPEEGRYQELRREWGASAAWKFFVFYQVQAVSCVVLALPFLLISLNDHPELNLLEKFSILLWLVAVSGVAIADMQLNRFKSKSSNAGLVCREGLWAWSRHPNYFFEWLVWLSYGLFALTAPWGFLGLISPALILHFVLNVTGIPPTEAQAVRSRGDAYRRYQAEVSAFIPLPPKA